MEAEWDWKNHSAEIVEARQMFLHERTLEEICKDHKLLADPEGEPGAVFYPGLADSGEHSEKVALPREITVLVDRLATTCKKMSHSDFIRHAIVLGLAKYMRGLGGQIETTYREKTSAILNCDSSAVASFSLTCETESGFKAESFRMDGHLFSMTTEAARHSGICRREFFGYLVMVALLTHPGIPAWHQKIREHVARFDCKINTRLKGLS